MGSKELGSKATEREAEDGWSPRSASRGASAALSSERSWPTFVPSDIDHYDEAVVGDWATIAELEKDRRSGAATIAERAAVAIARMRLDDAQRALNGLLTAHPSMAPLWRLASMVEESRSPFEAVARFVEALASDQAAPQKASDVLPETIITISYSSTVAEAIVLRRPAMVVCMRSEPGGEGIRMATRISRWTRAEVMEDDDSLRLLPGEAVLIGADAVSPTGVVNKVKSRALAEAASVKGLPRYAVAGDLKFVPQAPPVLEPFEETPLDLFTAIATPTGLLSPEEARARANAAPLHPHLISFLEMLIQKGIHPSRSATSKGPE
jgi:Initiation factor 2 subunit family